MDAQTRRASMVALVVALPLALLAGLVAFWGLGGFTRPPLPGGTPSPGSTAPVAMPSRPLSGADASACLAFVGHLPASVRGLPQRPVTGGLEQNAAYGDPAITLTCGGVTPPSVAPDALLWTLSGVCWYADQSRPDVTTWTTLDRRTPVSITVPNRYQGQGDWIQEFTGPIAGWVPSLTHPPDKCRAPSTAPS